MFHTSQIYLNKGHLKTNLDYLRQKTGSHVKFSSVIKGNAYGHGVEHFVPMAEEFGITHFSVFNANEALRAHEVIANGSGLMIMGMIDNQEMDWAIENNVEFFIFEIDRLETAIEAAKKLQKPARIHIELETGLHRTGFYPKDLNKIIKLINANHEHLEVVGACTHFAGAEHVGNYLRIKQQIQSFEEQYNKLIDNGIHPKYRHTACSAAVLSYPETIMDMVRVGISQYGFWPSKETYMDVCKNAGDRAVNPLRRIISWKSKVMSTKFVKAGDFIGYGTVFMATRDTWAATVPVGYANGFARVLSNSGVVLIRGLRASVIGMVNMNMMMIDTTDIGALEKGEEVVLIGHQGQEELTVASFGEMSNLLNYELLTRLPLDIPRYIMES